MEERRTLPPHTGSDHPWIPSPGLLAFCLDGRMICTRDVSLCPSPPQNSFLALHFSQDQIQNHSCCAKSSISWAFHVEAHLWTLAWANLSGLSTLILWLFSRKPLDPGWSGEEPFIFVIRANLFTINRASATQIMSLCSKLSRGFQLT